MNSNDDPHASDSIESIDDQLDFELFVASPDVPSSVRPCLFYEPLVSTRNAGGAQTGSNRDER